MTKAAIFDLDGTLWDATQVALPAFREVFEALKLPVPSETVLAKTLGYPLPEIWQMILPHCDQTLKSRADALMEQAELRIIQERKPRPFIGVEDTLRFIRSLGYKTYICSNCGPSYIQFVPDNLQIGGLFDARYAAGQFPGLKKAEIVAIIKKQHSITEGFMVGDRFHDLEAGKANSLITVGCLFGTGSREELQAAEHRISSFLELQAIVEQTNHGYCKPQR